MFARRFPAIALATVVYVGSTAGGQLLVASNAGRAELRLQPLTDAFRIGPLGSLSASAGQFVASGQILSEQFHLGGIWAMPVGGATAAIGVWESAQ